MDDLIVEIRNLAEKYHPDSPLRKKSIKIRKLQTDKSFWTKKLSLEENVLHKMEETKRYIDTLRNYYGGTTKAITDSFDDFFQKV